MPTYRRSSRHGPASDAGQMDRQRTAAPSSSLWRPRHRPRSPVPQAEASHVAVVRSRPGCQPAPDPPEHQQPSGRWGNSPAQVLRVRRRTRHRRWTARGPLPRSRRVDGGHRATARHRPVRAHKPGPAPRPPVPEAGWRAPTWRPACWRAGHRPQCEPDQRCPGRSGTTASGAGAAEPHTRQAFELPPAAARPAGPTSHPPFHTRRALLPCRSGGRRAASACTDHIAWASSTDAAATLFVAAAW